MEYSAHEATATTMCKVPGCAREALASRGTYALLCDQHKQDRRAKHGLGPAAGTATRTRLRAVPGSREADARRLLALGRKVDQARATAEKAKRKLQPALDALRAAEDEWQREVAALARPE